MNKKMSVSARLDEKVFNDFKELYLTKLEESFKEVGIQFDPKNLTNTTLLLAALEIANNTLQDKRL